MGLHCQIFEVLRSGFYDWLSRDRSPKDTEERHVIHLIDRIHKDSLRSYRGLAPQEQDDRGSRHRRTEDVLDYEKDIFSGGGIKDLANKTGSA